jgi:hypothetical protein
MVLRWTQEETELLKKVYPQFLLGNITREELVNLFGIRSINSIQKKASDLKLAPPESNAINVNLLSNLNKRLKLDIDLEAFKKHMRG